MSITTKDIAQICGVSRGTVDRALNNKGRISPDTKEMILKTAKEMGYRPDLLARSLVKGTSMSIGVVVFDIRNRYFAQLLNAIEIEAKKDGYFVNINLQEKDRELEIQLINNLVDRRVDGIILCPVNKGPEFEKFLQKLPIPVVIIGNRVSNKIPFIGIDERKAAKQATDILISNAYEQVVFVCPPLADKENENIYTHEQRNLGFCDAVQNNANISFQVIDNWDYIESAYRILISNNKKTAFFCSGDIFALEIMKDLRKKGKEVQIHYGIMGFDYIDTLNYITPMLSTIDNSVEQIGVKAVEVLFDLINGKAISKCNLLDYKIIDGNSI